MTVRMVESMRDRVRGDEGPPGFWGRIGGGFGVRRGGFGGKGDFLNLGLIVYKIRSCCGG